MPMMDLWKVRAQKAEAELAKCGRENCVGHEVEGCRSWVSKERLLQVQAEAESSAALVRKLAQMLNGGYWVASLGEERIVATRETIAEREASGQKITYEVFVELSRAEAESLLSDPAVENILKT